MNYIIKFDNREKELIKLLISKGHNLITENLDLGDIQFLDANSKELIIIIERKTLSDLSASIKDGRYKEQKERMIYSIKKSIRKILLIEGTNYEDFTFPINTLNSIIINTMIRDNIHIHLTKNIEDTIIFIENIMLQLPKYYEDLEQEIVYGEDKICNNKFSCKVVKKDNITEKICFRNMLTQIPGISSNMASIFSEKYNNMENFINILNKESLNDKSIIIKLLSDEKYGTRRIGEKIAKKIVIFIFNNDEEFIKNIDNIKKKRTKKNVKAIEIIDNNDENNNINNSNEYKSIFK